MLSFAKYKFPEQLLCYLHQCHRQSQCIYSTCSVGQLKSSENLSLQSVLHQTGFRNASDKQWQPDTSSAICHNASSTQTSSSSITAYNFEDLSNIHDATDFCKSVLHRLRLNIDEMSKQLLESGLDGYSFSTTCMWSHSGPSKNVLQSSEVNSLSDEQKKSISLLSSSLPGGLVTDAQKAISFSGMPRIMNSNSGHQMEFDCSFWPWKDCCFVHLAEENSRVKSFRDGMQNSVISLHHQHNISVSMLYHFVDRSDLARDGLLSQQVLFKQGLPVRSDKQNGSPLSGKNLPNADQLRIVQDFLPENFPRMFTTGHDYTVYTEDVIFENSWYFGNTYSTVGRLMYLVEVAKLRLFVHVRLANVRVQLLKTTSQTEDGTVRVRWRVSGISQTRAIMFWNYLPWYKNRSSNATDPEWLDGFSTFFVNQNGLIYKHKMDRVMPDENREALAKPSVIEKLAGMTAPATS